MVLELTNVINEQIDALNELLKKLDEQHKFIMDKDVFGLEGIVDEIQICNKQIAEVEVKRRKITGSNSISQIVKESNSESLDNAFREINKVLRLVKLQKETNEVLIRQGLGFTNKLLDVLNPKKETNVYNSYGHIRR